MRICDRRLWKGLAIWGFRLCIYEFKIWFSIKRLERSCTVQRSWLQIYEVNRFSISQNKELEFELTRAGRQAVQSKKLDFSPESSLFYEFCAAPDTWWAVLNVSVFVSISDAHFRACQTLLGVEKLWPAQELWLWSSLCRLVLCAEILLREDPSDF